MNTSKVVYCEARQEKKTTRSMVLFLLPLKFPITKVFIAAFNFYNFFSFASLVGGLLFELLEFVS